MGTRTGRRTSIVIGGALVAVIAGVFALIGDGDGRWGSTSPGQALTAPTLLLAVVALATVLRGGPRWPAVVALGWAGIAGLVLGGLGASPDPVAADIGPLPWADEVVALGGPRVAVSLVWVVASLVGLIAIVVEVRRRGRAPSGTSS